MSGKAQAIVLLAAAVFLLVSILSWALRDGEVGATDNWHIAAQSAGPVRIVLEIPGEEPTAVVLDARGPLEPDAKTSLLERFRRYERDAALAVSEFQQSMDASAELDLLQEAQLQRAHAARRAQLQMIEADRYITLPLDEHIPFEAVPARSIHYRRNPIGDVDVNFIVPIDEFPALKEAYELSEQVSDYYDDTTVARFNAKQPAERRVRWIRHRRQERRQEAGPPLEVQGDWQREKWAAALRAKMIPPDFDVDRKTYIMSKVER